MDSSTVTVFLVKTPQDCPGCFTAEVWGNVCDFCKARASGHIRPRHMVLAKVPPTALSAENCGGSNFITFCLVHTCSLTNSLCFSLSLFLLRMARHFKRIAQIFFDNLVFFHLHLADSHLGRLAVQVQQLTKLAFADCQHHTLPLVKTVKDQSCSSLTMA